MGINLIAINSIQTSDDKKQRVDVRPGRMFTVETKEEADFLTKNGHARKPKTGEKGHQEKSTADGLPDPPTGYAAGSVTPADINVDPNSPDYDPVAAAAAEADAKGKTGGKK